MVESCAVTIDIRDFGMQPAAGAIVTISEPQPRLGTAGTSLVVFDPQSFTIPTSGQIVVSIRPGPVVVEVSGQQVTVSRKATIPDQATANLAEWIDQPETIPLSASLQAVNDARAARDEAEGHAQSASADAAAAQGYSTSAAASEALAVSAAASAEADADFVAQASDVIFAIGDNPDGYSYDVGIAERVIVGEDTAGPYPSITVQLEEGPAVSLMKSSAAAQIATDKAEAAASAAEAATYDPTLRYKDRSGFIASTRAAGGIGTLWQAGASLFDEISPSATDAHAQNSATPPVKYYARPLPMGFNLADFGAVGGDATADTAAFMKAAALPAYKSFIIPPCDVPYLCNETINLKDGQRWYSAGARIQTLVETGPIFRADSIRDWSIDGDLDLIGTLTTATTVSTAIGLHVTNSKRHRVRGLTAQLFKGFGILVDGTTTGGDARRGDRGQWTDCAAHQNTLGIELDPGAGAEYNVFSNFNASGNALAALIDAGNAVFMGGNIVDNTNGIRLTGIGGNNAHGGFVGTNINHNTQSNLKVESVNRGFKFLGCHFYGNAAGSQGNIWIENSQGIVIDGGIIDAWIYNDLGANTRAGINRVRGAYLPTNHSGGTGNTTLHSNDGGLNNLEVLDCWTNSGPANLNDPAPIFVRATRGGTTQALTSGTLTTLIWNSKSGDKKNCLDTTTGVFTARASGIYRVSFMAQIGGTGLSAPYGEIRVNGSRFMLIGGSLPSSGTALVHGSQDVVMTEGQTMDIRAIVTGTSPALAVDFSRLSITLLR